MAVEDILELLEMEYTVAEDMELDMGMEEAEFCHPLFVVETELKSRASLIKRNLVSFYFILKIETESLFDIGHCNTHNISIKLIILKVVLLRIVETIKQNIFIFEK